MTVGNITVGSSLNNTCEGFSHLVQIRALSNNPNQAERQDFTHLIFLGVADELCASKHLLMDFKDGVPGTN